MIDSAPIFSKVVAKAATVLRNNDWLVVLAASWTVPLGLIPAFKVSYFNSLLFWVVPIGALLPRFLSLTHGGSRRRRALGWATAQLGVVGLMLDFVLGHKILRFNTMDAKAYVAYLPAIGMMIPVEEVLFYLLGPPALLLVYFWCDEFWLSRYNRQDLRLAMSSEQYLLRPSWRALLMGALVVAAGVGLKAWWSQGQVWVPYYFTYLVLIGFVPAFGAYNATKELVNWRALSVTVLYVLATSIIWEVTLAFPRRWWGYQPDALLGVVIESWTVDPAWPFPIEAVLVWLSAPFASVFTYELVKAYHYHPNRSRIRRLLPIGRLSASTNAQVKAPGRNWLPPP